jgi:hypothetical protein
MRLAGTWLQGPGETAVQKRKLTRKWSLILAILHHTRDILFLTDDHLAVLSAEASE